MAAGGEALGEAVGGSGRGADERDGCRGEHLGLVGGGDCEVPAVFAGFAGQGRLGSASRATADLQTGEQAVEEWRLRQVREALRVFRRGTENWSVERTGQDGESRVGFRVKTRVVMEAGPPSGGGGRGSHREVAARRPHPVNGWSGR